MSEISRDIIPAGAEQVDQLPAAITPMQMIQLAIEKGGSIDQLEKLMALQERWEQNEARKAYVAAMSAFKADPPELFKTKHVRYKEVDYYHAGLDQVANRISEAMSQHGLSFRWDTNQQESMITVSCVVTHQLGHSEKVTLQAAPDTSGSKNSIQAIGSTVSYLQRYTLLAVSGLATKDMDDDGVGAEAPRKVTPEQVEHLREVAKKAHRTDMIKLCEWLGVDELEDLTVEKYESACKTLEQFAK